VSATGLATAAGEINLDAGVDADATAGGGAGAGGGLFRSLFGGRPRFLFTTGAAAPSAGSPLSFSFPLPLPLPFPASPEPPKTAAWSASTSRAVRTRVGECDAEALLDNRLRFGGRAESTSAGSFIFAALPRRRVIIPVLALALGASAPFP
jgi:hypothetical protein